MLNLGDALAVRNEEKGGATYPLEPQAPPFRDVGVRVCVLWPGEPNALYHSEGVQEGFLVLSGDCTETDEPSEAYADLPGEYLPVRLPWPPDSDTRG